MNGDRPTWAGAGAIDAAVRGSHFSGVVTVDVAGARVFEAVAGDANRAYGVANTVGTSFAVASGSKAFTALAVMRLAEAGLVELDAPVRDWLGDELPLIADGVTLRHLLGHRSGIGDYLDESEDLAASDYVLDVPVHTLTTAEAFLPVLAGRPQLAEPDTGFAYSNSGFVVLALVIERATGEAFHDAVQRLVFDPAGLRDTAYLRLDELPSHAAVGYLFDHGDRANTLHLPVRGNGDGGAFTTAAELHRFWTALFEGRIVSAAAVEEMTTPRSEVPEEGLRYGLGFWLHPSGDAVLIEGADAGVSFRSTHDPATRTTVNVLGNTSDGAWPVIGAAAEALDAAAGRSAPVQDDTAIGA